MSKQSSWKQSAKTQKRCGTRDKNPHSGGLPFLPANERGWKFESSSLPALEAKLSALEHRMDTHRAAVAASGAQACLPDRQGVTRPT